MIAYFKNYVYLMVLFSIGYGIARWGAGRDLRRLMGPRYLAGYAITIFAGFFAPNIWLYHLVTIVAFLATTRDREDAICRYVVMIGLLPSVTAVAVVGPIYLGTYQGTIALSLAMLVAGVVKPDRRRGAPPARGWRVEDCVIAALFLVFAVGPSHIVSPTSLFRDCLVVGSDLVLPYYLVRRYVGSAESLQRMIGCIAFSAISVAVIAIYEARMSWPLYDAIRSRLSMAYGLAASTNLRGGSLRAEVAFASPLGLALFLMIAFTAWLCSRQLFAKPLLWRGGVVLLLVAIAAPQSRGLLLSLVPALMVLLAARRRFAAAAAVLAASGVGAAALFVLQHSSGAVAAFVGGSRSGDYYDYRGLLLHRGLQEGMKHWLIGQSYDRVVASLVDITQGEHIVDLVNTYLTVFLFAGVIGLFPVVIGCALTLRKLVARAPRSAALAAVRDCRAFLLSNLVGLYITLYGNSFSERTIVYTGVIFAMARLCSASLARERHLSLRASPPEAAAAAERLVPA